MKSSFFRLFAPLAILIFLASGCKKEAGPGGTSTITGKIWVEDYNSFGVLQAEYYGQEERVYITYGDNTIFDDDTRTDPDGEFKFTGLNKGTYTIFVYSDCDTCDSGQEAIEVSVEITDRKTEYTVSTITVAR